MVESERLDPGAGTLLNLGHCYEKNGQTASAWVTFKDAAAAADLKHRADWSQRARERAQALEPVLSRLTIDVPVEQRVSGLQVRRDGVEVGSAEWGTPIPSDPGKHTIEASAPGKKPWSTTVTVGAKADQPHVSIPALEDEPAPGPIAATPATPPPQPLTTPPPSAPAETPPPSSSGSTQRIVGLVAGGVGIVGLAVGSIFGGMAMGNESDSKNRCPTSNCASPAAVSENSDAKSNATISTVAMISGGVVLAAGAVIFLTAPKARPATAIKLMPAVGAGELGLRVGGAW